MRDGKDVSAPKTAEPSDYPILLGLMKKHIIPSITDPILTKDSSDLPKLLLGAISLAASNNTLALLNRLDLVMERAEISGKRLVGFIVLGILRSAIQYNNQTMPSKTIDPDRVEGFARKIDEYIN